MPFRFYRRFRAGPFRMNVSKRGVSWSIGGRGAWLTVGRGRVRESVDLPGTGLGWYRQRRIGGADKSAEPQAPMNPIVRSIFWIAVAGLLLAAFLHFANH
jgi:Protein of unknown function (DUF4236)